MAKVIIAIASVLCCFYVMFHLWSSVIENEKAITTLEQQVANCSCSVSYGGHNMSVEDALERMGEGLTVDQADEVWVMIDNAMNKGE